MQPHSFLVILLGCLAHLAVAFNHPGVFLDYAQLEFIRTNVNLGLDPWKSAYANMMNSSFGSLDRPATPFVNVECSSGSTLDIGCKAEREDALAAYVMSLAWFITKETKYAEKAVSIFNAWSYTLVSHNNTNAPLQSGWSGASWSRAAEIVRHTYDGRFLFVSRSSGDKLTRCLQGWNETDIAQFESMFRNVYIPEIINGSTSNGNWELGTFFHSF
jgi:Alginate lyase